MARDNKDNNFFAGLDPIRERKIKREKRKLSEKMRFIDPYGEEDWGEW